MTQVTINRLASLNDSPAYTAAVDKLRELQATESRLKLEINEIESRLREDQTPVIREFAVQSLLAGHDYHRPPGKSELIRLREEVAVVRAAITEQQQTVNSARDKASREICAGRKPQHDAAQRAMVLALLGATNSELIAASIREHLDSADVSLTSLPHLLFPEVGRDALEPCSRLAYLVREALASGLIQRSEVPAGWLTRWGM